MNRIAKFINKLFRLENKTEFVIEMLEESSNGGEVMDKQKILNQGIDSLRDLDLSNADGVTVNTFTYDDGSTSIEVGVSFPVTEKADTAEG